MECLVDKADAGDTAFRKRGTALYLQCRPMNAAAAARRDLRLACRLFLPRNGSGKATCASAGPGYAWGPVTCPACPGTLTLDAWHRITACSATEATREKALRTLDALLLRRDGDGGAAAAAQDGFTNAIVREIWQQRDTQRGRVFAFLATLGCPLPAGKRRRTGLPDSWATLLTVPQDTRTLPWKAVRVENALAVTFPAFDCLALAAVSPVEAAAS